MLTRGGAKQPRDGQQARRSTVGSELVVHQIIGQRISWVAASATLPAAAGDGLKATLTHQPLDALAVDHLTESKPEFGGHSWDTVGAVGLVVNLDDRLTKIAISSHLRGRVHLQIPPLIT